MSYLVQKEYVRYQCTCGSLKTICNLYFCRHCLELRCGYCLCHEVDTHYCSNCMEHLPPTEAKVKKNRCANCFDCPNCFHTLAVRATTRNPDESSKSVTKHYYLACFFCRWTTRDVGIPDQTVASGNWPQQVNPHAEKLQSYLEYYKILALKEKSMTDKKFANVRRPYSSYTDKFGLTSVMARKRAGLLPLPLGGKEKNLANLPIITPCVASQTVEPLPDTYFTEAPDLTKITRIEQRHGNPAVQPETTDKLYPLNRHFNIKQSLRCKPCEHNVSKPEYTPASIKFRIHLTAFYHMPEVRIMTVEPLHAGKECEIILKVTNPTPHVTSIQFRPLLTKIKDTPTKSKTMDEALKEQPLPALKEESDDADDSLKVSSVEINTVPSLPPSPFVLPPRDDAAEYDDTADTHSFQDDPKVVVWRKSNKAAVKFCIKPNSELQGGQEVVFGFSLDYCYVNTMPAQAEPRPQRRDISVNLYLTPGLIISSQK